MCSKRKTKFTWWVTSGHSSADTWCQTWFAQPKQHVETPVIQRLLDNTQTVLLFCRLVGEPYVYCGKLRCLSFDPSRKPMRFVWELTDSDDLRQPGSQFLELLEA